MKKETRFMTTANQEVNFIAFFLPSDDGSKITTPPPAATVVPTAPSVTSVPIGEIVFVLVIAAQDSNVKVCMVLNLFEVFVVGNELR